MFRPLRTLISLTMLAGMVWFAFAVELGDKTFAQHVDHISETPEAQQLIEGTRATINPAIDDVRDRMFGEYVEAPTYLSGEPPEPGSRTGGAAVDEVTPASTLRVHETDESLFEAEPARPGRRRSVYARDDDDSGDDAAIAEPERPGRRRRPAAAITPAPREPAPREPEPTPARPREPDPARPRWLPGALVPGAIVEPDEPEPARPGRRAPSEPQPRLHELPRFMQPKPPPEPVALHDLPLPRATIDDRRAAARMLELVERTRASLPPRPPSSRTIPIVQPTFDPTLPELPSE